MKQTTESSQPAARKITLGCVALASLFVLAVPGNATAAPPIGHFHEQFSDSFPNNYCDIAGTSVIQGVDNFTRYSDGTFNERFTFTETFTAAASQKSIVFRAANQFSRRTTPIDNGDGTQTFIVTFKGLFEQIKIPNGPVLSFDAGTVTFANTFKPGEDIPSSVIVELHGPHPDADGSIFCDVVVPALA